MVTLQSRILQFFQFAEFPYSEYDPLTFQMPHYENLEGCFWDGRIFWTPIGASSMALLHEYGHFITSADLPTFDQPNYGLDRKSYTHLSLEMDSCEISFALGYILGVPHSEILKEMETAYFNTKKANHWIAAGFQRILCHPQCFIAIENIKRDHPEVETHWHSLHRDEFALIVDPAVLAAGS